MVSLEMGSAFELERGEFYLLHELEFGVSLGTDGSGMGPETSRNEGDSFDRRGRDPMEARPQIPDLGLPDRRRDEASVMGRSGPNRTKPDGFLRDAGSTQESWDPIRQQRHVASLSDGGEAMGTEGGSRIGSISHHEEIRRSDRQRPIGRVSRVKEGWL